MGGCCWPLHGQTTTYTGIWKQKKKHVLSHFFSDLTFLQSSTFTDTFVRVDSVPMSSVYINWYADHTPINLPEVTMTEHRGRPRYATSI
jgi:hypothetical protein